MAEVETAYYLRMEVIDKPGVLAEVTRILADREISIEAMLQKEPGSDVATVPVIILTHRILEGQMDKAISQIEALETVQGSVTRIRLETLDA
jgi:homoserine dehydrogenase